MPDEFTSDDLAEVEAALRDMQPEDFELLDPPAEVWSGIEAELGDDAAERHATVTAITSRRPLARLLVAAAAAVVVAVGGVAVTRSLTGDDTEVIATAELGYDATAFDPLGADSSASVSLVDHNGLAIAIDEADLPTDLVEAADLELWLIAPDADGNVADLVSLGQVDPADLAEFTVPSGYDTDTFSIVDISIEPRDGDASHSGRSILRGQLTDV